MALAWPLLCGTTHSNCLRSCVASVCKLLAAVGEQCRQSYAEEVELLDAEPM